MGTELLLGDQVDTNSPFIAKELANLGIDVFFQTNVGDNLARLQETIKIAMGRSDLIIFTGGLGPTEDDLTKEALTGLLSIPLYEDPKEVQRLKEFFSKRGQEMPPNNLRQALIPQGSIILENSIGTASGVLLENNNKYFIFLPGPPSEMQDVFLKAALPRLMKLTQRERVGIYSQTLKFIGISESKLEKELIDLFHNQNNPTLALLAKEGEIHCRITAKVSDRETFLKIIQPLKREIMSRVGEYCYGVDQEQLEEIIVNLLKEKGLTLATAESCTGGLIAKRVTNVPGSSQCFKGGIVAYDNEIKAKLLNIPEEVLATSGAISSETALLMAQGALKLLNTDLALAITGNAGPASSEGKPVGLVYIALVGQSIKFCEKAMFSGDRERIRGRSSNQALNILRKHLINLNNS